jgi:hypothetical protein
MAKIFDREDEPNEFMEMPCRCDCGKWFDLNDGYTSERQKNKVICGACGETEEKEIEREDEIAELKEVLENAEVDIKNAKAALKKLGVESPDPLPTDLKQEAERLYPAISTLEKSQLPIYQLQRSAYLTAYSQFQERVKELEGEVARLKEELGEWKIKNYRDKHNL